MSKIDNDIKALEERLAELKKKKEDTSIPHVQFPIETKELVEQCKRYLKFIVSDEYHEDNEYKQWIYEAALEAVFGKDFFEWLNKRTS